MISVILLKMGKCKWFSFQFLSNGSRMTRFYSCHKTDKKFSEFIWFWGTMFQHMDFEPSVSRSITWFLFALKARNLVKWLILMWSFIWWGQFIDWLQFETRPSSPLNFGMAYYFSITEINATEVLKFQTEGNQRDLGDKGTYFFLREEEKR